MRRAKHAASTSTFDCSIPNCSLLCRTRQAKLSRGSRGGEAHRNRDVAGTRSEATGTLAPIVLSRRIGNARSTSIGCWKCWHGRAPQKHSRRAPPPRRHAATAWLLPCATSGSPSAQGHAHEALVELLGWYWAAGM